MNVRFLRAQCSHQWRGTMWEGCQVSILDNPQAVFSAQTWITKRVVAEITAFTVKSFGSELNENSNDGVYSHLVDASRLVVIHTDQDILGFAAEKSVSVPNVMYLHGVAVQSSFKFRGIGQSLIKNLMLSSGKTRLAFTTQNPVMFCVARSLLKGKISPAPENRFVSQELFRLGQPLLDSRPGTFEADTFVVRNLYGECLYPEIPQSSDRVVNEWFAQALNINDGVTRDGFLFVGEF